MPSFWATGLSPHEIDLTRVGAQILAKLGADPEAIRVLFLFGAPDQMEAARRQLVEHLPASVVLAGASTAGELGGGRLEKGGLSSVALGGPTLAGGLTVSLSEDFRFELGQELLQRLCVDAGTSYQELRDHPEDFLLVTLIDGLSGHEERVLASLHAMQTRLQVVGGSSGDDFAFKACHVLDNEGVHSGAMRLVLLRPGRRFEHFAVHHYQPTDTRLVVTHADHTARWITRLNGRPAVEVVAELLDVSAEDLAASAAELLPQRPVVFGFALGEQFFLRSVMHADEKGLLMGAGVRAGTVLRLMQAGDLVEASRRGVQEVLDRLPNCEGMLLFNCAGRLWEAHAGGLEQALAQAMFPVPSAGFTTYGEQFGPMQVNHTLTGVAFASSESKP